MSGISSWVSMKSNYSGSKNGPMMLGSGLVASSLTIASYPQVGWAALCGLLPIGAATFGASYAITSYTSLKENPLKRYISCNAISIISSSLITSALVQKFLVTASLVQVLFVTTFLALSLSLAIVGGLWTKYGSTTFMSNSYASASSTGNSSYSVM
jgi:hypothetical protein